MGNFQDNAITDSGRLLLGEVQMGATFTPTRIVIGSGRLPAGTTSRTIKNVVNPVIELQINKKRMSNDGTVVVGGVYSNETIKEDFYFRELALYAKAIKADGKEVPEVLYSYGNAGETADFMPSYDSGMPVERQIDIATRIGNDAKVDLTVESGIYMTQEQTKEVVSGEIEKAMGDLAEKIGKYLSTRIATVNTVANGETTILNINGPGEFYAMYCNVSGTVTFTIDGREYTQQFPANSVISAGIGTSAGWSEGKLLTRSPNGSIGAGYVPIKFSKSLKIVSTADGSVPVHVVYAIYE